LPLKTFKYLSFILEEWFCCTSTRAVFANDLNIATWVTSVNQTKKTNKHPTRKTKFMTSISKESKPTRILFCPHTNKRWSKNLFFIYCLFKLPNSLKFGTGSSVNLFPNQIHTTITKSHTRWIRSVLPLQRHLPGWNEIPNNMKFLAQRRSCDLLQA